MNVTLPQNECEKNGQERVMLVRKPRVPNSTISLDSLNLYFTGNLHSTMLQKRMCTAMLQELCPPIRLSTLYHFNVL